MIRNFCTLLAIVMAVSVAFAAPLAEAQGQAACVPVVLAEPDPPAPTPTATGNVADSDPGNGNGTIVGSDQAIAATKCADAQSYPGPFTAMPAVPASPYSAPIGITTAPAPVSVIADTATGTAATTTTPLTGRDLAHSGTETFVLAYLGTGLLAFGAFAMGIRRGGPNHRNQL